MIANFRSDGMLVFNRKVGETIVIGDITITVLQKGLNGMRLGIEAPRTSSWIVARWMRHGVSRP
jgi:carbon storage regulator CsrA